MASVTPVSGQITARQNLQRHSYFHQSQNLDEQQGRPRGSVPLDIPQRGTGLGTSNKFQISSPRITQGPPVPPSPRARTSGNISRQRPTSLGPHGSPGALPAVTVKAPLSHPSQRQLSDPRPNANLMDRPSTTADSTFHPSHALSSRYSRNSSASQADLPPTSELKGVNARAQIRAPRELSRSGQEGKAYHSSMPPPINRTEKPRIPSKHLKIAGTAHTPTLAPPPAVPAPEERISPFNTPPSSEGSASTEELSHPFDNLHEGGFQPPPVHHSILEKRREQSSTPLHNAQSRDPRQSGFRSRQGPNASTEYRPGLPPRPGIGERKSTDSISVMVASAPATLGMVQTSESYTHSKRSTLSGANLLLEDHKHLFSAEQTSVYRGAESPTSQRQASQPRSVNFERTQSAIDSTTAGSTDFPDFSETNRKPPSFIDGPYEIHTKYDTRLFAICGQYLCTTGYLTRVWDIRTGEQLLSISHGETIKVTALAFKPGGNVENEGKRLWLGTSTGELLEIDIRSQSVVLTKINAHFRKEVVKIYRHQNEMWSFDCDGRLHVWPPGDDGLPNLESNHTSFKVPKGHSFSLIIADQLWFATGRDIRVFQPSIRPDSTFQILQKPLNQPGVGDVTSGAVISSQLDRAYFGHTDGKVTIYSTHDYACLGVINVSVYKINSLAGAGQYLWAGYNTGMIYVYDTESNPWKVKKDWQAHENPVASILVDRSSIWKLGRLQVASLGNDNAIRIWDGMLEEDWLGRRAMLGVILTNKCRRGRNAGTRH